VNGSRVISAKTVRRTIEGDKKRSDQFIGGFGITMLDGLKYAGDVAQPATVTKLPGVVPVNLASVLQTKKSRRQFHCWRRKDCPVQLKNHGPVAMFHRTMA